MKRLLPYINTTIFLSALYFLFHGASGLSPVEISLLSLLVLGAGINILAAVGQVVSRADMEDITLLYVHGFTDDSSERNAETLNSFNDYYVRDLANYSKEIVIILDHYVWDSFQVTFMGMKLRGLWKLIKYSQSREHWALAKSKALREGRKLYVSKIRKFEKRRMPYYIIAYSLGTRIVLEALNHCKGELKMLKGIFFLGSALPFDKTVTSAALKNVKHIINYHSRKDMMLGKFYESEEGVKSGGHSGFSDEETFLNMETFYDHGEYVEMIYPVCNIILYQEGSVNLLGQYTRKPTHEIGNKKWHSIYMVPHSGDRDGTFCIQFKNNRYRAVELNDHATFMAESDNLHLLMKNLFE